jgi:hypothetical protein
VLPSDSEYRLNRSLNEAKDLDCYHRHRHKMSTTTIQTSKKTAQKLRELMKETGAKSYDEVISRLIGDRYHIPVSLFGSNPNLAPLTKSDETAPDGL